MSNQNVQNVVFRFLHVKIQFSSYYLLDFVNFNVKQFIVIYEILLSLTL